MRLGAHFQRRHKGIRQGCLSAEHMSEQAPGVVLYRILFRAAIGHALFAVVGPTECRFNPVAGVVRKGQTDGASGGNGQQVRVTQPGLTDGFF